MIENNRKYISIPESEYKRIESDLKQLEENQKDLLDKLKEKDNIIIFNDKYHLVHSVYRNLFGKESYLSIKQEDFIENITKDFQERFNDHQKKLKEVNKIPKWIRKIFIK